MYEESDRGERWVTVHDLTEAPAGSFTAIDADYHRTCGLRTTGAIVCWGYGFGREGIEPGI